MTYGPDCTCTHAQSHHNIKSGKCMMPDCGCLFFWGKGEKGPIRTVTEQEVADQLAKDMEPHLNLIILNRYLEGAIDGLEKARVRFKSIIQREEEIGEDSNHMGIIVRAEDGIQEIDAVLLAIQEPAEFEILKQLVAEANAITQDNEV